MESSTNRANAQIIEHKKIVSEPKIAAITPNYVTSQLAGPQLT